MSDKKRFIEFTLLLLALSLVLLACSPVQQAPAAEEVAPAEEAAPAEEGASAEAAAPAESSEDRPVIVTWSRSSDPPLIDPAFGATVSGGIEVEHNVYDTLLRYEGETTELVPNLAESWEVSPDATSVTFKLREDVKFHNGDPFTADDVKFVWERAMAAGAIPASYWEPVESMEIIDDYTVKMNMKYPYAPWSNVVAGSRGMYIGPSQESVEANATEEDPWAFDYFLDHENGTGPYMLENWERDVKLEFTKFDDYWRGWDQPHADKHVFLIIKDDATARLMLEKGDLDILATENVNPQMAVELEKNPDVTVRRTPSFINFVMHMNMHKPPLDDVRVRRALSYLFDYQTTIDDLYVGYGQLGGKSVVPSTLWPEVGELEQFEYNIDKARELLKEAGWEDRGSGVLTDAEGNEFPPLEHMIMDMEIRRQMTEVWMAGLQKLGIKVNPNYVTWPVNAAEMGKPIDEKPAHISGMSNWPSFVDPADVLRYFNCSEAEGGLNWAGFCNEEFETLTQDALATSDQAERERLYADAIKIVNAEAPVVIAAEVDMLQAYRSWVKNYQVNPGLTHVQIFYPVYIEGRPPEFDHLN
jgi:peptide/nickel transport system substrate-binding protein